MTLRIRTGHPVYGGYTFYKEEGKEVIFVKGALPEELVDIVIKEKKKDYSIARVVEVIEPSGWRVKPICEVSGICGGCQLQHVEYNYQLTMKAEILKEILKRIARLEVDIIPVRSLKPFNYRYRAQFKIGPSGAGFYKEGSRELVPVSFCPLMKEEINSLLPYIAGLAHIRSLKEVHVSTNGRESLLYLKGINYNEELLNTLGQNGLVGIAFENRSYGQDFIELPSEDIVYTVSARSFFQTNWELNRILLKSLSELINNKDLRLLDLYAGAGNFSIPLSSLVKEVVAVEENLHAFNDLKRNVERNGIKNVRPVNSSIERFRPSGHYEIIIVDPPRSGLTDKALRTVLEAVPHQLIYISCNPVTLSRDIKKLSQRYEVHRIELFDFFPNTYHIETLVVLKKRS